MTRAIIVIVGPFILIWAAVSVFTRGVIYAARDTYHEIRIEWRAICIHWKANSFETERERDE